MVRFFKVHPYSKLDFELQTYVRGFLMAYSGPGSNPPPDSVLPCLTLMASMADLEALARRRKSMPLVNSGVIKGIPMLNRLFDQFGIDLESLAQSDSASMGELATQGVEYFLRARSPGQSLCSGARSLCGCIRRQVGAGLRRGPSQRSGVLSHPVSQGQHTRRRRISLQRFGSQRKGCRRAVR